MKHTTDIDMKNARPTILSWICKIHDVNCDKLDNCIKNRDDISKNFNEFNEINKAKMHS
jgi:hypothetical protein